MNFLSYLKLFLIDLKFGLIDLIKDMFNYKNYLSHPSYISFVYLMMMLLSAFGMPPIIAIIYGLIITVYNTSTISAEIIRDHKQEPLTVEECIALANQYKPKRSVEETEEERLLRILPDVEISKVDTPVAKQGEQLFELLFRNQPTRIVSAVDEKSSIEVANLSVVERNDLLGILKL